MRTKFRLPSLFLVTSASLLGACAASSDNTDSANSAATGAAMCNTDEQLAAFTRMREAPIVPLRSIGGIDLAGDDSWTRTTIDAVERVHCQSTSLGGDETTNTVGWGLGSNLPVTITYDKTTRMVDSFMLRDGFRGSLEFHSRPTDLRDPTKPNPFGVHTYSIGVGRPVLRDGQAWELRWKKPCAPGAADCWDKQTAEMFDALMYTFAPELPSTQESCIDKQLCIAKAFSAGDGVFGVRPLGIYFYVPDVTTPSNASTPSYFYGFYVKLMAFSGADLLLKLDDEGPVATAAKLGDRSSDCVMKLGVPFQSFLSSCVQVMRDAGLNDLLKRKLLGGASRSVSEVDGAMQGTWVLDVQGVRPGFGSERFDERTPTDAAKTTELRLDVRTTGRVLNDYSSDGATLTLAATGAVYREYAKLVQEFLHANMPADMPRYPIGAPECLLPAGGDAARWRPAYGCTGIEQMVTPAEPSTATEPGVQTMSAGSSTGAALGFRSVLRPGDPTMLFCSDPGVFDHCGYGEEGPAGGLRGTLFDTYKQIVRVLGENHEEYVFEAAKDNKVYARLWTAALVKSLQGSAPADADIKVEQEAGDWFRAKYRNRFEYRVHLYGNIPTMIFR